VILVNLTMKTNSKIIIFLLIAGLSVPMISFATMNYGQDLREQVRENIRENIQEKRAEWQAKWQEIKEQHKKWQEEKRETLASKSAERENNLICSNLEKWVVKIDQILTEREMKIEEKQTERLEKLNERRENRDTKLEEHREKWEEKWEEHFAILEEKASTSEQRQALVEFKETVQDIRASRQAAVDTAIFQFRTSLDGLIADRKEKIEEAKTAYINAYNVAIQNAKQACSDGGDPSQIRETLKTALKAAKDKFNADKQAIEKMDVKKLVETRQQAFKEALEYFKKAMEKARADLKAVFNQ
jgi:tetratricopeptide (TPR) repeat protein